MSTDAGLVKSKKSLQTTPASRTLPALLEDIRKIALPGLLKQMRQSFDASGISLLKRAEKAKNNNEQTIYFDAMKELRSKRDAVEASFRKGLLDNFDCFPQKNASVAAGKQSPHHASSELSLVHKDDLEEGIAIDTMVVKARSEWREELYHLSMRLDAIVLKVKVDEANNVMDPGLICDALLLSVEGLEIDIQSKLILYKQFDLAIMSNLGPLLRQCNDILLDAGVLPDLKYQVIKDDKPDRSRRKALTEAMVSNLSEEGGPGQISEIAFSNLQSLLTQARAAGQLPPRQYGGSLSISPAELSDVLGGIESSKEFVGIESLNIDGLRVGDFETGQPSEIRISLLAALEKRGDDEGRILDHDHDDVINLVEMLFDFVLDDHYLPPAIQALIARLQIPIIKVALKDKEFFNNKKHPARKLLNELAHASVGWNASAEHGRDEFLEKVYDTVFRVVHEFQGDLALFEELYEGFHAYVQKDARRIKVAERRTHEYETGVARTKSVKAHVKSILDEHSRGQKIAKVIYEILYEGWSKVLYSIYLNEGEESLQWEEAVQIVVDLIWSTQPLSDVRSQQQRAKMLPDLLNALHRGLTEVSFDPFEMNALFARLGSVHISAFRAGAGFAASDTGNDIDGAAPDDSIEIFVKQSSVSVNSSAGRDSVSNIDDETLSILAELESAEPATKVEEYVDPHHFSAEEVMDTVDTQTIPSGKSWEEMTAVERQQIKLVQLKVDMLKKVDELSPETWFEFQTEEGDIQRCKLIEKITNSDEWVFVNRRGRKVFNKTKQELADAMRIGSIKAIEKGLLLDRAFMHLFGRLKENGNNEEQLESLTAPETAQ